MLNFQVSKSQSSMSPGFLFSNEASLLIKSGATMSQSSMSPGFLFSFVTVPE